jgi:hypothetical protein
VEPEFQQWQSEQQQQEQHELRASSAGFLMRAHDLAVGLDELELVYPTPGVTLAELLGAYYSCRLMAHSKPSCNSWHRGSVCVGRLFGSAVSRSDD